MKQNYFIGLGGSGGKIIARLYDRLIKENGMVYSGNVECIAIDTDQDELNQLAQLGVRQVCLSGAGNVGQYYNNLGGDVDDWCPNTPNEGNFFSSSLFDGASQCRMKSRLCFSNYLKNSNNSLRQALEESLRVDSHATGKEAPPKVLIASSIAGGTGSGIFIQTALYVKKVFREFGIENVKIYGLFACPDLYKGVVTAQQLPSLYANAYAVIRELNAFNLICGSETTAAYGGKLDIDIEISTECEGNLFTKDANGRYGDKPYDSLYFIDKVNYLSKVLGGIDEYYKAMADMAYTILYTDIAGEVASSESNEMNARSISPIAIYGSAGAARIEYPYEDILRYFANRSVYESVNDIWKELDKQWAAYYKEKDIEAAEFGKGKYLPAKGERAQHFIDSFDTLTKVSGISGNKFSFLIPMVKKGNESTADALISAIKSVAKKYVESDSKIVDIRTKRCLDDLEKLKSDILIDIDNPPKSDEDKVKVFGGIADIDSNIDMYCKETIEQIADYAMVLANEIFCINKELCGGYDTKDCSIIKNLLQYNNGDNTEWVHPIAARYSLYKFYKLIDDEIRTKFDANINTPADDKDDYYTHMINNVVADIKSALSSGNDVRSNSVILLEKLQKIVLGFGKKDVKAMVDSYFETLDEQLGAAKTKFIEALCVFAFIRVRDRLAALIDEYEAFFDGLDEFIVKAYSATVGSENFHDGSKGAVYVCASAEIKKMMYENVNRDIDTQTGEIASSVSQSLFTAMRDRISTSNKKQKMHIKEKIKGIEGLFNSVSDIVTEGLKYIHSIQRAVDRNVFQAILYEFKLLNPGKENYEGKYNGSNEAKNLIDQFVSGKFVAASRMAAPCLVYDTKDPYSGMFKNSKNETPRSVSNAYRYFANNPEVDESIKGLIKSGSANDLFDTMAPTLPLDTDNQTVAVKHVCSDKVDSYSILCYSTVHCLQPYQIKAFDEINGGVYYDHYSKRIIEMEKVQKYSLSPHIDKRWHKHGVMPYINVSKEIEKRLDLGKAFLYSLLGGKIGYSKVDNEVKLVFGDASINRAPELMYNKGRSVTYRNAHRAMYWLVNEEALVERYSSAFDRYIEAEIEKLADYSDSVGEYKARVSNYSKVLKMFLGRVIGHKPLTSTTGGKVEKNPLSENIGVLELAYKLHKSEEKETDKDYGELVVAVLCDIIKKYSKAPFNADDIASKDKGKASYLGYLDVYSHILERFLEELAMDIQYPARKADPNRKPSTDEKVKAKAKAEIEAALSETDDENALFIDSGRDSFGRADAEGNIGENSAEAEDGKEKDLFTINPKVNSEVAKDEVYAWVYGEIIKNLND
ncbi:MAG: hypothetical protein IKK83_00175 [Clostridia bacterium]|nr:hypothetical protein [Clostridia bacterium]